MTFMALPDDRSTVRHRLMPAGERAGPVTFETFRDFRLPVAV
jgi:hypothetical protein